MRPYLISAMLLALVSCASVKNPEGGPKDSEAPRLLACVPGDKTLNFKGKNIQLLFSEEVAEDNFKVQFLSPKTSCTASAGSKRLKITPDSGFMPNTTYVLNLKGKIKDEREGNKLKDTSIVFSTGPSLDSLTVEARAEYTDRKQANHRLLMLLSKKNKQVFTALTDSMKPFLLRGLNADRYEMQIFQDRNENYSYEEEDGPLWIDSLRLDSSVSLKGRLLPQKYKPVKTFALRKGDTCLVESSVWIKADKKFQQKVIASNREKTLFRLFPVKKNLSYRYTDSLGNAYADTILLSETDSIRSLNTIPSEKSIDIFKEGKILKIKTLWNWKVLRHPEKLDYTFDSVWVKTEPEKLDFGFTFKLNQPKTGKLKWRTDSLVLFNLETQKRDSIRITGDDLENPGTISGEVIYDGKERLILELTDLKGRLLRTSEGRKFSFSLKPDRYRIQMYLDKDGNGMYTGGNKEALRKAEPLYIFPEILELKPGWDLENIKPDPGF